MPKSIRYCSASLIAGLLFAVGMSTASSPAEAGKIGKFVAKTATKAAVRSVARSASKDRNRSNLTNDDADDDDDDNNSGNGGKAKAVDSSAHAEAAKSKLEAERREMGFASALPTTVVADNADTGSKNINAGIVCIAGC